MHKTGVFHVFLSAELFKFSGVSVRSFFCVACFKNLFTHFDERRGGLETDQEKKEVRGSP